jgi:hypothetical protein
VNKLPTIKGSKENPIIIGGNKQNLLDKMKESKVKVGLPFKATNFKAEILPLPAEQLEGIEMAGYENVKEHKRGKKKVKKYTRGKYGKKK